MKLFYFLLVLFFLVPTIAIGDDSLLLTTRGITLSIPLKEMAIENFLNRSINYMPKELVRDGLPHFGVMRDDWLSKPRKHKGIDIYADKIDVVACGDGTVVKSYSGKRAGGLVKINHGKGIKTLYLHLTSIGVKPGQKIKAGQTIGHIDGLSGNNYEPQLHFELQIDGRKVDPITYIKDTYAAMPEGEQVVAIIEKAEKELPEKIEMRKKALKSFKQ